MGGREAGAKGRQGEYSGRGMTFSVREMDLQIKGPIMTLRLFIHLKNPCPHTLE